MKGWEEKTLGEIIELQRGYDLPDSARIEGDIPVIGSAGLTGFHNIAKAKGPGVTMGRSGNSIGKITYVSTDYWPHNACMFIKNYKGNDLRFIYYLLSRIDFKAFNSGGAQPSLNRNLIYPIKIYIPPLPTQRKIASILSAYDDLIENNLKRIKLLEEMARRTYEEWFVKFRINGKQLPIDKKTGLPEGWTVGTLKELVSFQNGFAFKSSKFVEFGQPVIKIKNIGNNTVDIINTDCIDEEYAKTADKFQLFEGDLLIAMTGATVGKVGYLPYSQKKCYLNQRVGKFINYKGSSNIHFVFSIMTQGSGLQQVLNLASGAAQPNISGDQILSLQTVIPTKDLLVNFNKMCETSIKQILILSNQNRLLKESRDMLLPRLMSGGIEIKE